MLLNTACDQFLAHCRYTKQLSEHTNLAYTRDLSVFRAFSPPDATLDSCSRNHLRDYMRYLFEDQELKSTSVKRRMACVKAMFRWLELEDVLEENPFRKLHAPIKLPAQLPKGLSATEIRKLLLQPIKNLGVASRLQLTPVFIAEVGQHRAGFAQLTTLLAMELLFSTGIRVGELVTIQIKDLNITDGTIVIHGKGDRERLVFLPDDKTGQLLRGYLNLLGSGQENSAGLLRTSMGGAVDPQYIRLLIRKIGEHARISRRVTPHMFRHTAATHLLDAGVDMRYVQKLLGHQSITTTQIYTQVSDKKLKSLIRRKHPINGFSRG